MTSTRITNTFIGKLLQVDYVAEVSVDILYNSRAAARRVLENPDRFPDADFELCEESSSEIDIFLRLYADELGIMA